MVSPSTVATTSSGVKSFPAGHPMHLALHFAQHLSEKFNCSMSNAEIFYRPAKRAKAVSGLSTSLATLYCLLCIFVED